MRRWIGNLVYQFYKIKVNKLDLWNTTYYSYPKFETPEDSFLQVTGKKKNQPQRLL